MMYYTVGKKIYPLYKLPLFVNDNEDFLNIDNQSPKFSIFFIERGSGVFSINKYEAFYTAPIIFYLNENDIFEIKSHSSIIAKSIYFHPNIVNSVFNFENIRLLRHTFSNTELQDCYLLFPFFERNLGYKGQQNIRQDYVQKISVLFQTIKTELDMQKDIYWPCRSRSLFLELLILASNLFDNDKNLSDNGALEVSEKVAEIITFLQTNYEKKITVNGLAKAFNINRTTLNSQFRSITNLSIIDYLIKHRINLAATLLRDTLLTITEIIERVGFSSGTHFWRMFKKHTGLYHPSIVVKIAG